ncbi:MAG TPA: hydroxymethylpyrimidine/phosphomethylpyrimidine kinase [Pseudohongiella sp.]|nr:hydroxymethylpyrimidine/phosphomethylpyrimidine kinase [Pseudohongiella sp.]
MSASHPGKPLVLCISGLDPTGGAGIQADIETINALGCHTLPVISSLTVQSTVDVKSTVPCDPELIKSQVDALLECGLRPDCIKLGLIDSPHTIAALAEIFKKLPDIPLVADPVLKAGGGYEFSGEDLIEAYREVILPRCTVLTPNVPELYRLHPDQTEDRALAAIISTGCKNVLLTGTHAETKDVLNRLYDDAGTDRTWTWPRLAGEYHGSGCTLASAVAAGLAQGQSVTEAAERAQHFTWNALKHAIKPGKGQYLPDRRNRC